MYVIKSGKENAEYIPYGAVADFIYSKDREVIIAGPSETGKTLGACWKVHIIASKYPGSQLAIVRATYKSMPGSVLQTLARVIQDAPVSIYGGERPEKYNYSNGSVIWIGGMDNPDKVLSSERDLIYVNQAEELTESDWEVLTTRVTGRAGNIPHPQLIGDCNPSSSRHWIRARAKAGKLRLIVSTHRDNPTLYDGDKLTDRGIRTMQALQALTGVRYKRLYQGEWATAEGAVYEAFNHQIHVKSRELNEFKSFGMAIDEGYTNPAVILYIGIDSDGRLHIIKEFYQSRVLQSDFVQQCKNWYNEDVKDIAVDESAAGLIAELRNNGLPATGYKGRVLDGISIIQDMLKVQGDGKPRLTVDPSCVNTINEFESYVWKPERDEPVKENDHALDALRYFVYRREAKILFEV